MDWEKKKKAQMPREGILHADPQGFDPGHCMAHPLSQ